MKDLFTIKYLTITQQKRYPAANKVQVRYHTCLLRMSVQRSPIRGSGSGSEPDLSSMSRYDAFVGQRKPKRKLLDMEVHLDSELQKYRQDMVSLLEKSTENQNIHIAQLIREELADIKKEIT